MGHEGKTVLVEMLPRLLPDTTVWVNQDLFGKTSKWPDAKTVSDLCQKRFLVCDQCDCKDSFSYSNVKSWTSGGCVTVEDGSTVVLSKTAFVMTSNIPFIEKSAINNSIGRRMVIYHMNKRMGDLKPIDRSEITNTVVLEFISLAVAVFNFSPKTPYVTPAIAIYTLFRKNVNKNTAGLIYDSGSDKYQCMAATSVMATRCGVDTKTLVSAFNALSPNLVKIRSIGMDYVLNFRLAKMTYTDHGLDVVREMQSQGSQVVDLDAVLDRCYPLYKRGADM